MTPATKANLLFLLTTAIWGTTFSIIETAVKSLRPELFVCLRFTVAALVFLPFILPHFKKISFALLSAGLILGVLNALNYGLQTASLQHIPAARCAFITGSGIVMVPIFSFLLRQGKIIPMDFLAALICLFGLYIITGANFNDLNYGDLLALLGTTVWAFSLAYVDKLSSLHYDAKLLAFLQIAFTAPFPLLTLHSYTLPIHFVSFSILGAIIYCGAFATVLPLFLQAKYLRDTTAAKAALIFALEPVFAAIFSALFYHEPITHNIFFGGIFILISICLSNAMALITHRST